MTDINKPIFSIIIPAYNTSNTIKKCIDSILYQNFDNLEVIIVDDGSEDDLNLKLTSYLNGNKIKYFHTEHLGCSNARNIGLSNACGKYILFCDADDEYLPNSFTSLFANIDLDLDIIVFGAKIHNCTTNFVLNDIYSNDVIYENKDVLSALFHEPSSKPYVWNKCYRKDFLIDNKIFFPIDVTLGEDQIFQFDAYTSAKVVKYINAKLYCHNFCSQTSINKQFLCNPEKRIEQHITIIEKIDKIFTNKTILRTNDYAQWIIDFLFSDVMKLSNTKRKNLKKIFTHLFKKIKIKHKLSLKNKLKLSILQNTFLQTCYLFHKRIN